MQVCIFLNTVSIQKFFISNINILLLVVFICGVFVLMKNTKNRLFCSLSSCSHYIYPGLPLIPGAEPNIYSC